MKSKIFTLLSSLLPAVCSTAEFDSTVHLQIGTQYPEETSHIKVTGNFYDFLPDFPVMWIVSPKIYFNPSVPVDFAMSAGLKTPVGPLVLGYHGFGHFHNFGDFPVNQYGHTFEVLHNRWEAKINYYHPANGVYPMSAGIISSQRFDSEFTFKTGNAAITVGPVYQIQDRQWGLLGRMAVLFESTDVGIEINRDPNGETNTSLFTTFRFPNKKKPAFAPKGNNSYHYTNLSIESPGSQSTSNFEIKRFNTEEFSE